MKTTRGKGSLCASRRKWRRLWTAWWRRHRTKGGFTKKIRKLALLKNNGQCAVCGLDFDVNPHEMVTVDHMVPRSKGGTNRLENAQVLCLFCHRLKSFDEQKEHLAHSKLSSTFLAVAITKGFHGACKCFNPVNHDHPYTMLSGCPMKEVGIATERR